MITADTKRPGFQEMGAMRQLTIHDKTTDCTVVHTLSVSHGGIGTVALNRTGEWLALGCG